MGEAASKICPVCKSRYSARADFRLMRLEDGSRVPACARCRSRPHPGGAPAPRGAEEEVLAAGSPKERRRHPRRRADLTLTFTHLRDRRKYHGVVRDISQGGLRFLSPERLAIGDVINLTISGRNVETRMRAVGQVVRVIERGHDYEIGVRFTGREQEVRLADRRRHKRIIADFEIRYRREGHKRANVGRVRDISQGGIRFVASERIPKGEVLQVLLDSRAAGVIELEMKATLRVTGGASVLGAADLGDRYEIRAKFV